MRARRSPEGVPPSAVQTPQPETSPARSSTDELCPIGESPVFTAVGVALDAAAHFGAPRLEIVSGYRSEKFNELWRKKGHQVAPTN